MLKKQFPSVLDWAPQSVVVLRKSSRLLLHLLQKPGSLEQQTAPLRITRLFLGDTGSLTLKMAR